MTKLSASYNQTIASDNDDTSMSVEPTDDNALTKTFDEISIEEQSKSPTPDNPDTMENLYLETQETECKILHLLQTVLKEVVCEDSFANVLESDVDTIDLFISATLDKKSGRKFAKMKKKKESDCTDAEAWNDPNWKKGLFKEYDKMREDTWHLMLRSKMPKGRTPLKTRNVYKYKINNVTKEEVHHVRNVVKDQGPTNDIGQTIVSHIAILVGVLELCLIHGASLPL